MHSLHTIVHRYRMRFTSRAGADLLCSRVLQLRALLAQPHDGVVHTGQ